MRTMGWTCVALAFVFGCDKTSQGQAADGGAGGTGTPAQHTLHVHVNGSGQVLSSIPAFSCGTDCTQTIDATTTVHLSAVPDSGWTFSGWQGDCSGTGSCTVTMDADHSVTALFAPNQPPPPPGSFRVTAIPTGSGTGRVTSSPAGIDCPGTCTMTAQSGSSITLTAQPASGSTFAGWGGGCNGPGSCTLTASADVWADFEVNAPPPPPACSQPGPAAVAPRTYVIDPAGREPEYSAADQSGTLLFGVTVGGGPFKGGEAPLVSPEGTTKAYLSFAKSTQLHAEPSGFSGFVASFGGQFSVDHLDADGHRTGSIVYQLADDANTPIISIADPRSGTLLLGKFRRLTEPESAASRRASFVSGGAAPAESWSAPLASAGAVFGAGLDLSGNALVISDGSGRWGAGAISAQWIGSSGADLTGEFLLLSGFLPGSNTWFEVSALGGGGVAVRRVDAANYTGKDVGSQYLCVVPEGAAACDAPPGWLSSRRNVRIESVRNGAAYAVLPDPTSVSDCTQTVELVDSSGASCGSMNLRMAEGSCLTRALAVGKDGTLIQPLANEAWQCGPTPRPCRATWRWWTGIFQ